MKKTHTRIEDRDAKTQQLHKAATSAFVPQESRANEEQEKLMRLIRKRRGKNTDGKWEHDKTHRGAKEEAASEKQ